MKRARSALLALFALGPPGAVAQETADLSAEAPAPPREPAEIIAAWRESLLLDLPAEVLGPGPRLVAPGGPLEHEGQALALLARALFDAGRRDEARRLLDPAHATEATRAFVELEQVRLWLLEDELERALAFLRPLAPGGEPKRCAKQPESWLYFGRALSRSGDAAASEPYLRRFVELAPLSEEAPSAWHMLAQAALQRGDGEAAKALSDRGKALASWHAYYRVRVLQIREKPSEPLPRLGLAQLWLQANQFERARGVLSDLVALAPEYAPGWFHLAEARRLLDDFGGAQEAYSRALALDPELVLARYNRAVILLREGREAEARADFEALVGGVHEAEPRLLSAHLALARILLRAGEQSSAEARYRRYVELGGKEALALPGGQ